MSETEETPVVGEVGICYCGFTPVVSPDGRFLLRFGGQEMRMSHWVMEPSIEERATGRSVMPWLSGLWDGAVTFTNTSGVVEIEMRKYPGNLPGFVVTVNLDAQTFAFVDKPEVTLPLANFATECEAHLRDRRPGR
jgi:hypothetical protein